MDVAVSSGVTTLDWVCSLDRLGIQYTMTAGDLNICAYLLSLGRYLNVLVDSSGYPLQYDIFGHAVPNPPARRKLPVYLPWLLLFRLVLIPSFNRCSAQAFPGVKHDSAQSRIKCRPLNLVSPRLVGDDRIELIEDDILSNHTIQNQYHVIRAANILNRSYFLMSRCSSPSWLISGSDWLTDGLLVVCSTTGDQSNELFGQSLLMTGVDSFHSPRGQSFRGGRGGLGRVRVLEGISCSTWNRAKSDTRGVSPIP